jgi:hypothetical protein
LSFQGQKSQLQMRLTGFDLDENQTAGRKAKW